MYPYLHFNPSPNEWDTTFAYWICLLLGKLPTEMKSAGELQAIMSFHCEVEEQAYNLRMLRSNELIPKVVRPIAPVTFTYRWAPFELGAELLGKPIEHGTENREAYCIWEPHYLGETPPKPDGSEHENHALFLLRLAASAAIKAKAKILVVGSPGWSIEHEKKRMMNPDTSLLMHEFGYLYTERISR